MTKSQQETTKRSSYAEGYQAALGELASMIENDGLVSALSYAAENSGSLADALTFQTYASVAQKVLGKSR